MPKVTEEEYRRRVNEFLDAHLDQYTEREVRFIRKNATWGFKNPYVSDILRQIYDEVGLLDDENNLYLGFLNILEENFDINCDIIEIGGGIIPSLAQHIALRQKSGTITVYDPRIIEFTPTSPNLILKREMFDENTSIEGAKMLISCMPCDATRLFIDTACKNELDFMLALCEGGMRKGYEWLETDEEWIGNITYDAAAGMEGKNMGILCSASLERYGDPYPVIYNKRKKS